MVEELYRRYVNLTGDPQAAAMLVLAHSNLEGRERESADGWLTVKEAADRLRVHPNHVYDLCRGGELPHSRVGRAIRVKTTDLDNHQVAKPVAPQTDPFAYVAKPLPDRRPRGRQRRASA